MIQAKSVSVGTAATRLSAQTDDKRDGTTLLVKNAGPSTVYVGPSGVTTATGFPVATGETLSVEHGREEALFGIVASGTQAVNVLIAGA